jgi:TPR repeat protein
VAHEALSDLYQEGEGVEKDIEKELYHLEEAAIGGHPDATYKLAMYEGGSDRFDETFHHRS